MRATLLRCANAALVLMPFAAIHAQRLSTPIEKPPTTGTPTAMNTGTPPSGVSVTGSPATATVTWQAVPGAVGYRVTRWKADDPSCCRAESPVITATTWTDTGPNGQGLQWSGSYVYQVLASQADLRFGTTEVTWARPEPANPANFRVKQQRDESIVLEWNTVPGASSYWLFGPGLPSEGKEMNAISTFQVLMKVPYGPAEWKITTKYDPAGFLLSERSWPRASMTVEKLSGYYRVVLNGVSVNEQTTDNALNLDGWGDELRIGAMTYVFDRGKSAPSLISKRFAPEQKGPVYGDVNKFPNRVKAGSAGPTGGIVKGDMVPSGVDLTTPYSSPSASQLPFVIWEGQMTNTTEALVIDPWIMEVDEDDGTGTGSLSYEQCGMDYVRSRPGVQSQLTSQDIGPVAAEALGAPPACERPTEWDNSKVPNRYIGDLPGKNNPTLKFNTGHYLVLTREKIERALGANSYTSVRVDLRDQVVGENGNYTLYLLIERM